MTGSLISWEQGSHSIIGKAGGFRLFTVGYGTRRQEDMWYLETSLPVSGKAFGQHYRTREDAQAAAEKVLMAFIARVSSPADSEADR